MTLLALALAGAAGALARYGLDSALRRRWPGWPTLPVLLVNVSGSLLLGLLVGLVTLRGAPDVLVTVAGTGFCGSFTTFSTATVETLTLLRGRRWATAATHAAVTLVATTLAAGLGLLLATAI